MKKIGEKILENKLEAEIEPLENGSFFKEPTNGEKNYFTFADYSNERELFVILSEYLKNYNIDDKVIQSLSNEAFALYQNRSREDESGDLSEFIYIMH
tara:strand:- start:1375 stop:1668 length:294 start_codon:yes stop_codon:yes gene_type:complete